MSILRELLTIKAFRERKAEAEVRRQHVAVAEATSALDRAERRLVEFRDYARQREKALFDELCSRLVHVGEIHEVHDAVGAIKTQERDFQQVREQADETRTREVRELDARRQRHVQATRLKEKFVELVSLHAAEQVRLLEHKEDAEMEEVASHRRDRADWDGQAQEEP